MTGRIILSGVRIAALALWACHRASWAADLYVPADYPTLQAAVDAAAPGDTVHFGPGRFNECLTLAKPVTLAGSGTNECVVFCLTNLPIISITGPGMFVLRNFELEGGQYMGPDWYSGFSPKGIVASNADLFLDTMVINQVINSCVTALNCNLQATDVSLWNRPVLGACDLGFQLKGCTGVIRNLRQDTGHLDHTININDPPANHSDLEITNCSIRASIGSYGNCIRTYTDAKVRIRGCYLYRSASDPAPNFPAFNHNGVSISGYSNQVTVLANVFTNLPWAMFSVGSLGGNQVMLQSNLLVSSLLGGIACDSMSYEGIDLGGGRFGSKGGNVFSFFPGALTNGCADILLTYLNGFCSANIFALNNTWSNPTNCESGIYDKLDNSILGRVITKPLAFKSATRDGAGRAVLTWNERAAGEKYTIECTTDLSSGTWTNAPGSWPILNPSLKDMCWTNPTAQGPAIYYRISSIVP